MSRGIGNPDAQVPLLHVLDEIGEHFENFDMAENSTRLYQTAVEASSERIHSQRPSPTDWVRTVTRARTSGIQMCKSLPTVNQRSWRPGSFLHQPCSHQANLSLRQQARQPICLRLFLYHILASPFPNTLLNPSLVIQPCRLHRLSHLSALKAARTPSLIRYCQWYRTLPLSLAASVGLTRHGPTLTRPSAALQEYALGPNGDLSNKTYAFRGGRSVSSAWPPMALLSTTHNPFQVNSGLPITATIQMS